MSIAAENEVRRALGLPVLIEYAPAPICGIHGRVHYADPCTHNGTVVQVVALRADERVTKQRPPKPAHVKPAFVAEATANLVALAEVARGKPRSFTRNMVR